MQVFKTALKVVFRSPVYLLVYIVFFGLLGLGLVVSLSSALPSLPDEAVREDLLPTMAIIDRDQSAVSEGMAGFLEKQTTLIALDDNIEALQDATAKNLVSYILIIPEGFGEDFLKAARSNETLPVMESVVSIAEADGMLVELLVNRYLQALQVSAVLSPEAPTAQVLASAAEAATVRAEVNLAPLAEGPSATLGEVFYFLWIAYPLTLGLIALTGMIFATFRDGELRRRNLSSPISPTKMNTQVALGSVTLILLAWGFMMLLSLLPVVDGLGLLLSGSPVFLLLALAALVYALVPFSLGFLLSQFGLKEAALNGAANILSLSFSFLGGIFMGGAAFLGETMQVIAHVIPTYWYTEAVFSLTQGGLSGAVLSSYFANLGVVVLFAVAFFSVALLVGRRSAQSSDAGGNTAAEAVV
ncbi:MAG: ABC transporter permease [Coriobacteriia bacterium]|nr:ABC transporter permease [Coriobacteriia bacterium]